MIDIAFLRSGSKGNATLLSDGKTLLLVDMGVAKSVLQEGCALFEKSIEDIDAVFSPITIPTTSREPATSILERRGTPLFPI